MEREAKPWTCANKHHLGVVVRNGSGIRQLLLYRQAINPSSDIGSDEVDVMAVVEGHVMDVVCSICGCVRTWVPGQEALDRLLANYRKNKVGG